MRGYRALALSSPEGTAAEKAQVMGEDMCETERYKGSLIGRRTFACGLGGLGRRITQWRPAECSRLGKRSEMDYGHNALRQQRI